MYVVAKTFLKFIYRYCMPSGPIFLTFIHIRSHTGEDLAKYLLQYLEQNGINIQNCRDQSYDNASNMSGKYIGMQAQLKRVNPLINWVPCTAHSPEIAGDDSQKADARHEADTLSDSMDTLEFNLMLEVWNKVLQRFNMCSKILQAADIDLHTAVALLESLKTFISGVRDQFDEYETNAKTQTDVDYRFEQRARRRRLGADRLPIPSEVISGTENFKRNTFLPILHQPHVARTDRMNAYTTLHQRFSFLSTLDRGDLQQKCQTLCNAYADDLPQEKELYLERYNYRDLITGFIRPAILSCTPNSYMRTEQINLPIPYLSQSAES